jgi:hypothetical protein
MIVSKLGLFASPTPFVTGRPHTLASDDRECLNRRKHSDIQSWGLEANCTKERILEHVEY